MAILLSAAAMAGGIIAIVFSLSTFSLQNAADLFSSEFFSRYSYGWKDKLTYWSIVGVVLLMFSGGATLGGFTALSRQAIDTTLLALVFAITVIFALVDWQYETVRNRVNPLYALCFIEKESRTFLKRMHEAANDAARLVKLMRADLPDNAAIAHVYQVGLESSLGAFDRHLEILSEVCIRLALKQDSYAAKRGFDSLARLLCAYIEVRKGSSVLLPTEFPLAFRSDSSEFLGRTLERLNTAGEGFMIQGQSDLAAYLVRVYEALAEKARSVAFLNARRNENPIFFEIQGYHRQYIDCAVRRKDMEAVFQSSRVLRQMAQWAAQSNANYVLSALQNDLAYVAQIGIVNRMTFITQNCFDAWVTIIIESLKSGSNVLEHEIGGALKKIASTVLFFHQAIKAGLVAGDFTDHLVLVRPYDGLVGVIGGALDRYGKETDPGQKQQYRYDFVSLFEELNRSLRTLSEQLRSCNNPVIGSIGRLLFTCNRLLIDLINRADFEDVRAQLLKQLQWNIHLPYWFFHHSESTDGWAYHRELTDCIIRTGIILLTHGGDRETIEDCIDVTTSIAKACLEKKGKDRDLDEPRIMLGVCYLGILGLKRGLERSWVHAGLKIYEFEDAYTQRYLKNVVLPAGIDKRRVMGLPQEDQLYLELLRWASEFDHRRLNDIRLNTSPDEMMLDLMDQSDIERFMWKVWERIPADSPILKEIEEEQMKALVMRLATLLKQNILQNPIR